MPAFTACRSSGIDILSAERNRCSGADWGARDDGASALYAEGASGKGCGDASDDGLQQDGPECMLA